jgi:hypothetical protein
MIESICGACEIAEHKESDKVRSPGVKYKHYKPKCETALYEESEVDLVLERYIQEQSNGKKPYIMCSNAVAEKFLGKNLLLLGNNEFEIAHNLYDKLLEGEKKADIIIAIAMPDEKGVRSGRDYGRRAFRARAFGRRGGFFRDDAGLAGAVQAGTGREGRPAFYDDQVSHHALRGGERRRTPDEVREVSAFDFA